MWNSFRSPLLLLLLMVSFITCKDYSRHSLKLRCFQCYSPQTSCQHGVCYGDVCVKTAAMDHRLDRYIVKGCENITRSVTTDIYEPHMKHKNYCKIENVMGIETTICYCRDGDWCNSSSFFSILYIILVLLLL